MSYDPYGVVVSGSGSTSTPGAQNPFLFKGGIQDRGTGWIHYGNRWYNPVVGQWTQQDTLDSPLDPQNANRYAYAGDDPINNSDPTGRWLRAWKFATMLYGTYGLLTKDDLTDFGVSTVTEVVCSAAVAGAGVVTGGAALVGAVGCFALGEGMSWLVGRARRGRF